MGGNSSKQVIETTLETDVLNKNIQNFITNNSQKVSASGINRQEMEIILGDVIGCDLISEQTINSEVVTTGTLSEQKLQELKSTTDTHLDNNVDALMEKMTGFGSLQVGNDTEQDMKQTIKNKLKNITERTFDTTNYNELIAKSRNIQDKKYTIGNYDCTKGGSLNFKQDITSKLIATALTDQIVDTFLEDEQVVDVINQIETEQTNRDEGVGEAVEGMGTGVGNAFRGIGEGIGNIFGGGSLGSIIAMVFIVLIIGGIGYYIFKKRGGKAGKAISGVTTGYPVG